MSLIFMSLCDIKIWYIMIKEKKNFDFFFFIKLQLFYKMKIKTLIDLLI